MTKFLETSFAHFDSCGELGIIFQPEVIFPKIFYLILNFAGLCTENAPAFKVTTEKVNYFRNTRLLMDDGFCSIDLCND